jgi:hypothetical protein
MKKKVLVFSGMVVLIAIISAGLGYTVAYVRGLQKVIDIDVRAHCNVLLIESLSLSRSHGIRDLIDSVEQNCDIWASFIRVNEPYGLSDTPRRIAESLEAWEKAKSKLEELRSSYVTEDPNNT